MGLAMIVTDLERTRGEPKTIEDFTGSQGSVFEETRA